MDTHLLSLLNRVLDINDQVLFLVQATMTTTEPKETITEPKETITEPKVTKAVTRPLVALEYPHTSLSRFLFNRLYNVPVLIISTQYPGYGGGATNSYNIFMYFTQCLGLRHVQCIFNQNNVSGDQANPLNLDGVFVLPRYNARRQSVQEYRDANNAIIAQLKTPKIMLAKNYVAPILGHMLFPDTTIQYLVSGSASYTKAIKAQEVFFHDVDDKSLDDCRSDELKCLELCENIVCNSDLSIMASKRTYPESNKLTPRLNTSLITAFLLDSGECLNRDIDIVFAVSHFKRTVKNPKLGFSILKHPDLREWTKYIIGDDVPVQGDVKNLTICPKMANEELMSILQRTRYVILPSFYDACSNLLFESLRLGCKVITSKNVGFAPQLPAEYIVDDYKSVDAWVSAILECPSDAIYTFDFTQMHETFLCFLWYACFTRYESKQPKSVVWLGYEHMRHLYRSDKKRLEQTLSELRDQCVVIEDYDWNNISAQHKWYITHVLQYLSTALKYITMTDLRKGITDRAVVIDGDLLTTRETVLEYASHLHRPDGSFDSVCTIIKVP